MPSQVELFRREPLVPRWDIQLPTTSERTDLGYCIVSIKRYVTDVTTYLSNLITERNFRQGHFADMCSSTTSNIDTAVMHIVEKLGEDERHLLLVTKIRVIQDTFENNGCRLFELRTNMDDTPAPSIAPRESVSQVGDERK